MQVLVEWPWLPWSQPARTLAMLDDAHDHCLGWGCLFTAVGMKDAYDVLLAFSYLGTWVPVSVCCLLLQLLLSMHHLDNRILDAHGALPDYALDTSKPGACASTP